MFILLILIGIFTGYLVNYLADTLPFRRKLTKPPCTSCKQSIPWRSYLLMGNCPDCGHKRGIRSWVILVVYPILFNLIWYFPHGRLFFWMSGLLLFYFGVVFTIDVEHKLILHMTSLPGALLCAGIGYYLHDWLPTLVGGIAGFLIMLLLYMLGIGFVKLLSRIRKQEIDEVALGFGDVTLSTVLGLLLGWPGIIAGLIFAILLGGVVSLFLMAVSAIRRHYQPLKAIPYGPFLILSGLGLLYFGSIFS